MEIILVATIAFFLGKAIPPPGYADLSNPDRILKWDTSCFGYRPVVSKEEIQVGDTILLAFETTANPDD